MSSLNVLPRMLTSNHNESAFIFSLFFGLFCNFCAAVFHIIFFFLLSGKKKHLYLYSNPPNRYYTKLCECLPSYTHTHTHSWALCIVLHTESSTAFFRKGTVRTEGFLKLWWLSCFIAHRDQGKTPGKKTRAMEKKERLTVGIMAAESSWEKYNTC